MVHLSSISDKVYHSVVTYSKNFSYYISGQDLVELSHLPRKQLCHDNATLILSAKEKCQTNQSETMACGS